MTYSDLKMYKKQIDEFVQCMNCLENNGIVLSLEQEEKFFGMFYTIANCLDNLLKKDEINVEFTPLKPEKHNDNKVTMWTMSVINKRNNKRNKADKLLVFSPSSDGVFEHSFWNPIVLNNHKIKSRSSGLHYTTGEYEIFIEKVVLPFYKKQLQKFNGQTQIR